VLEEHGLLEETERSRLKVAVDVYHKEHLLTKEEFEDVFQYKRSLHAVLPSKDVTTVDRIAEILDKHGFVAKARDIRALAILYQGEGLLSEEECIHMGSSLHLHDVFSKVVLIIINKSTSVSYRICEVFEKYEILSDVGMRRLKVVLDVYQIEHLLREEELKEAIEWEWHRILPSKDAATATRIGEILEKHGLKKEARELRGWLCV
jgi:hydroxypyruvate isomerase